MLKTSKKNKYLSSLPRIKGENSNYSNYLFSSTNQERQLVCQSQPQNQVLSPLQRFSYINIGKTSHSPWRPCFSTNQNNLNNFGRALVVTQGPFVPNPKESHLVILTLILTINHSKRQENQIKILPKTVIKLGQIRSSLHPRH